MNVYNYTELRQNLKQVLDKVADDCEGVVIKRRDAEDAVIISKSHYDSLMETVYLLKSPANAKHLMDAIAEDRAGKLEYHDLIEERPTEALASKLLRNAGADAPFADRRKRGVQDGAFKDATQVRVTAPPFEETSKDSPLGMRDEEEE